MSLPRLSGLLISLGMNIAEIKLKQETNQLRDVRLHTHTFRVRAQIAEAYHPRFPIPFQMVYRCFRRYRLYVTPSIELFELVWPVFIYVRFVESNRLALCDAICLKRIIYSWNIYSGVTVLGSTPPHPYS